MKLDLKMPSDQAALVETLLLLLERERVERLAVFPYCRPGESQYWLAYLFVAGARQVVGTPDLRDLPLEEQLEDLLCQLRAFQGNASAE
jgi:hypothetical protein